MRQMKGKFLSGYSSLSIHVINRALLYYSTVYLYSTNSAQNFLLVSCLIVILLHLISMDPDSLLFLSQDKWLCSLQCRSCTYFNPSVCLIIFAPRALGILKHFSAYFIFYFKLLLYQSFLAKFTLTFSAAVNFSTGINNVISSMLTSGKPLCEEVSLNLPMVEI